MALFLGKVNSSLALLKKPLAALKEKINKNIVNLLMINAGIIDYQKLFSV